MTAAYSAEPILSPEAAIAALSGEDNQIRYYAAWWLGKHQVQAGCMALCQALFDDGYRIPSGGYPLRRQAARALGQLKNPQAVPALIKALECDEDMGLREAVIQALAAIGDKQAVNPLLNLLQSSQPQPYEALIEALATFQEWSARSQIKSFLNHPSERVQCAAARYLYLLTQEPQYIERIVKNLNHDNMYLRWAAIFDLGAVGHRQAVDAILAAPVANSLKLLNLKRILEALLNSDRLNADSSGYNTSQLKEDSDKEITQLIFQAIDDLLIQL
jgi:phycoerythrocyanin alpha-cysteine-84 phycoviolobilin lyase/isomerase subunit PecE